MTGMSGNVEGNAERRIEQLEPGIASEPRKTPLRIAILISGSGSNLQALIDALESKQLSNAEIVLVVSNKADAYGLQRALKHKLPAIFLPWRQRAEAEAKLTVLLNLFKADLIILAGWMRILSADFITGFSGRILNLHPALIPDDGTGSSYTTGDGTIIPVFRGLHAVKQALDAGVKVTGSTVHYVTPEVDAGPVICREEVAIEEGDTEETLHERLKLVEHRLIVEAVKSYAH
jgi:phosphoribosylglycinamide formyltransferase 1